MVEIYDIKVIDNHIDEFISIYHVQKEHIRTLCHDIAKIRLWAHMSQLIRLEVSPL